VIKDAEGTDGGQYVLKLKNDSGSAEAPIKVTVLGKANIEIVSECVLTRHVLLINKNTIQYNII